MKWLDDVVAAISPERAVAREAARFKLRQIDHMKKRGYEGAKTGGRVAWTSGGSSANAEASTAIAALRNRSRDLVRNNPYANKCIATLTANSIGTGFMVKLPKKIQPLWKNWTEYCDADGQLDYYGLQSLIARSVYESGECLVRLRQRLPSDGFEVPLQLQVIEPDYLDSSRDNTKVSGGGWIWGGIEFNAIGQRVAYWIFPEHPGEVASFRRKSFESNRVPAEYVQHIYEKTRPGQARGIPKLAASMMRIRDLDDYEEAELVRKGYEACFAAFVIGKDSGRTLGQSVLDSDGRRTETLEAGMIAYIDDSQDVKFGQPSPMGGYGEYTSVNLHAIAAGSGVTYGQLTGDMSRMNFSSARVALNEFRRLVEVWQWLTFIPMQATPTVRAFEKTARIAGKIKGPLIDVDFTPPKWDYVNPTQEVAATRDEIAGGLASLSEKLRSRGYDPEQVFSEIGSDVESLSKAAGIPKELVFSIMFNAKSKDITPIQDEVQP